MDDIRMEVLPDSHLYRRHDALPEGFTPFHGGDCPVHPTSYVDLAIRTDEGIGTTGRVRANMHDWDHPREVAGHIVGWQPA